MRNVLKSWGALRTGAPSAGWLLLNVQGDYQYRNPDSVYIHPYETFHTEEDAREYLARNIAVVDQKDWRLYSLVAVDV